VLLEITLNTGSVVLEGTATRHGGVLSPRRRAALRRASPLRIQSNALADRIVSRYFV